MGYKKWVMPYKEDKLSAMLSNELDVSVFLADVLVARGKKTVDAARAFLENDDELLDPFSLLDMDKAVDRIGQAIESAEKIAIYGDYDADGVTATAIMVLYLESAGADVTYYIPSREDEGYGMNNEAVKKLFEQGVTLIVTVDNGITAAQEIAYAKSLGIDVVVTDHHKPKGVLPDACAVVDPHRSNCTSSFKDLCGAGIALKLVMAIDGYDSGEILDFCGDLAAIGTIADIVPLVSENRMIVIEGMNRLAVTQNLGLAALIECCGIGGKPLTSEMVAFTIVPRINAAGRLGLADVALRLLLTDDYEEAKVLAEQICGNNTQRQQLELEIMQDIKKELVTHPEITGKRVIVLAKQGWHPGVAGIVASRLVEQYAKPCFLISIEGETSRGSGRSVNGYSMFEALLACDDLLLRYGGHTAAAGLTIKTEDIEEFKKRIEQYSKDNFSFMPVNTVKADKLCEPDELTIEELKKLAVFEPFGCGNEAIRYCYKGLTVTEIVPIGGGKHLRLRLTKGAKYITCVYFGMTEKNFPYKTGDKVDVLAACDINEYQGKESISVKIKDIRPAGFNEELFFSSKELYERYKNSESITSTDINIILPNRDEIAAVYRLIHENGVYLWGISQLAAATSSNYGKTRIAVEALQELGLIAVNIDNDIYTISIVKGAPKADLSSSKVLSRLEVLK